MMLEPNPRQRRQKLVCEKPQAHGVRQVVKIRSLGD